MNTNNSTQAIEDNIENAVHSLAQDLMTSGVTYDRPIPQLYLTTLGLIFLIHTVFIIQWTNKMTRGSLTVTYDQIIHRKQFHRLLIAMFSHPPPDRSFNSVLTTTSTTMSSFEIHMGDGYDSNAGNRNNITSGNQFGILRLLAARVRKEIMHPLIHGHLAGLPLLTYISHILWQCRPLEEIYDYSYDSYDFPHQGQYSNFNITSIIDRDTIVRNSLRRNSTSKASTPWRIDYQYSYSRVLIVFILSSYMIDFFVTYMSLRYIRKQHQERRQSTSTTSFTVLRGFIESQVNRGICTLTPMCIATLILYTGHFPHTPISVLPFINTSYIFGSASEITFIVSFSILAILSKKSYPYLGMFYGSISGFLWTSGWTCFLADSYWGGCFIAMFLFACATSLKAKQMHYQWNRVSIRPRDWFFFLDYVCWDANGRIRQ